MIRRTGVLWAAILVALGMNCSGTQEATEHPRYSSLKGTAYITRSPLFIVNWGADVGEEELVALPPGYSSDVPATLDDYLQSPVDWKCSKTYREAYPQVMCQESDAIIGYFPSGTKLRIEMIQLSSYSFSDAYVHIYATGKMDSGKVQIVNISLIMTDTIGKETIPQPDPMYLEVSESTE